MNNFPKEFFINVTDWQDEQILDFVQSCKVLAANQWGNNMSFQIFGGKRILFVNLGKNYSPRNFTLVCPAMLDSGILRWSQAHEELLVDSPEEVVAFAAKTASVKKIKNKLAQ